MSRPGMKNDIVVFEVADGKLPDGRLFSIFNLIKEGKKTIDIRARTSKYQGLRPGDEVLFRSLATGEVLRRWVKAFYVDDICAAAIKSSADERLHTVVEMAANNEIDGEEGASFRRCLQRILPGARNEEEVWQVVFSWPGNKENIEEYGAVAFVLEQIKE